MVNLISKLSEQDKKILNNYIKTYGIHEDHFIGLDNWLQNWNHSKQKMYKLLGNKFIVKVPFTYEKTRPELYGEVRSELLQMPFKTNYHAFYVDYIVPQYQKGIIDETTKKAFSSLSDADNFVDNKVYMPIKLKKPEAKRMLQIQDGAKVMKAFSKVIEYFKDDFDFNMAAFEDFRIKHSLILNDKTIKGNLVFSIHPMDFITMSDNASGWSSCMSWKEDGCYRVGTVEMLNSNNVICSYIEREKSKFCFAESAEAKEKEKDNPDWNWNDKRWRCLIYVNKDIIMNGKSYPYKKDDIAKAAIAAIKDLAKENFNWSFAFGPELYKDMKHIDFLGQMDKQYYYRKAEGNNSKKNIIWETRGMYNDMFNDHNDIYWCYRNKVKHKKIISVSGKAPCLCCGSNITDWSESDEDEYYNDRFRFTGQVICGECRSDVFYCDECECHNAVRKHYTVTLTSSDFTRERKLCENCFLKVVKKCPCCGKPMYLDSRRRSYDYKRDNGALWTADPTGLLGYPRTMWQEKSDQKGMGFEEVYVCDDCWDNFKETQTCLKPVTKIRYTYKNWDNPNNRMNILVRQLKDNSEECPYRYINLEGVEPGNIKI